MADLSRRLERIVALALSRPLAVVAAVGLAGLLGGALALTLRPSASTDTLVDRGSDTFQATERFRQRFGDDAVVVLVRQDLGKLLLSRDQGRLGQLEGCIAGNVPPGTRPPGGPGGACAQLARDKPAFAVYGPATFINESATQLSRGLMAQQQQQAERERRAVAAARGLAKERGFSRAATERLAEQARTLVRAEFVRDTLRLALTYNIRSVPRPDDPSFVSRLVFDPGRGATTPKARFAYILPNPRSAVVQVRLRPDLSEAERTRAIEHIRAAIRLPEFRLDGGGTYTVTGAPVLVSDLTSAISRSIITLLLGSLAVMALTLLLVFRSRPRLLPLGLALAATGVLFGAMAVVGASLTMASIAVLPILVGLGVDYAIQLQSRLDEVSRTDGLSAARAGPRAAAVGGPTVATACGATVAGFFVLLLSPVPMVRGFGLLLMIGVALAFACALTAGFAALSLVRDPRRPGSGRPLPPWVRAGGRRIMEAGRGAGEILAAGGRGARELAARARFDAAARGAGDLVTPAWARIRRLAVHAWRRALASAFTRPTRVLGIGLSLALVGFVADTQTRVVSDVQRLVPQDLPAVADLNTLQRTTGVAGEIDVLVSGRDLSEPDVIAWMTRYQRALLKRYRYNAARGCGRADLCPAVSLPDLFRSTPATAQDVRRLLDAVPPYFSQAVISRDRRLATMAFGIRLMPLDRQQEVIEEMRRRLDPPPGVRAQLVGLPVLAAEANAKVSSDWRRLGGVLLTLVIVALVLLLALRRVERALVPLVPIALAGGWSALVLFLVRIPLNPMSVTLSALVIAISTEFSVLLAERYRQERAAGREPAEALARTYATTGRAVLASAATAIAGFAVLMLSGITMLRHFGAVTVIDLSVSLLGVMVVLPAVLVLEERGELRRLPSRWLEAVRAALRGARPKRLRRPGWPPRPRLRRPGWPPRPRLRRPRLRRPRPAGQAGRSG